MQTVPQIHTKKLKKVFALQDANVQAIRELVVS